MYSALMMWLNGLKDDNGFYKYMYVYVSDMAIMCIRHA